VSLISKIFGRKSFAHDRHRATPVAPMPAGRAFIEAMFAELYPGQIPKHAALPVAPANGLRFGRSSVEGADVYDAGQAWHYVTLGLTDLYDQSDASLGPNGIRCELSMRLAKRGSAEPPLWPVAFLRKIASHVSQGSVLAQAVAFRTGPIPGAPAAAGFEGALALLDPGIKPRPGPFGKVGVILLVGVTGRQLDEIGRGGSAKLIADIAADPSRQTT
jgi:hypothetical protein